MWELGDSFIARYKAASVTLGKKVAVTLPSGEILESEAVAISDTGSLLLSSGDEVTVGDVIHLR
jgi:biotin-(acetyl-CoA carboxylase) ligase